MRLKGISLPINAVIVIALAVMVLLLVAAFLGAGVGQMDSPKVENAWSEGCSSLQTTHDCEASKVSSIDTGVDIDGDEAPDSLLKVCRERFGDSSATIYECRNECCNVRIREGVTCGDDRDCQTTHTADWECREQDSAGEPLEPGRCCPNQEDWNSTSGVCE